MIYECEQCKAALPPGVLACPKCGEVFEEPVPRDAVIPKSGWKPKNEEYSTLSAAPPVDAAPNKPYPDYILPDEPFRTSSPEAVHANQHSSYWSFTALGLLLWPVGLIIGIVFLTKSTLLERKLGEHTVVVSILGLVLGIILSALMFGSHPILSGGALSSPTPISAVSNASVPENVGNPVEGSDNTVDNAPIPDEPQLAKGSEHFGKESDYNIVSGEITNMGNEKLDDVEATTTFYDSDGNVVKTADAVIDFNPLMPGQTSSYKTMATDNPLIKTEKTEFHSMGGPLIPYSLKSKTERVNTSDVATEGNGNNPNPTRDPVSEVATSGSSLSDRPLKRSVLQNTVVTEDELTGKSLAALSISYNTIYAAHGYIFKRRSLQGVFDQMSWYHPNPSFAETDISQTERTNLKTIRDLERKEYHY